MNTQYMVTISLVWWGGGDTNLGHPWQACLHPSCCLRGGEGPWLALAYVHTTNEDEGGDEAHGQCKLLLRITSESSRRLLGFPGSHLTPLVQMIPKPIPVAKTKPATIATLSKYKAEN